MNKCLSFFLIPSQSSSTPLYPQSTANQGMCPNSLPFRCFHFRLPFESIKEFHSATKACKGASQEWARESHFMLPGVQESVRKWTLTLPSELPLWELESQWTSESLKSDCKGQNSLDWKVLYIIGDAPPSSLCDPKRVQSVGFAELVRNSVPLPASNTKRGRGVVLETPRLD
jgi:hypothetical protein